MQFNSEAGDPTHTLGPPVAPSLRSSSCPLRHELAAFSYYLLGHGALNSADDVSPVAKVISVFSGKPPFGHFFGTVK
jgi:hypothetical protein